VVQITINPKIIMTVLFSILCLLAIGHFSAIYVIFELGYYNETIFDYVNLDDEQNLPTFFSAFLLLFASLLLFVIFSYHRQERNKDYKYWLGLACIFLFLAVDESSKIHEKVIDVYWTYFGMHENDLVDNFIWVAVYGTLALIVAALYFRFVISQPRKICCLIFISAGLYVSGALGMEILGALYIDQSWFRESVTNDYSHFDAKYFLISGTEETMEMLGALTFVYTLLKYIEMKWNGLSIHGRLTNGPMSTI
jgi:hypothetical protein